MRFRGGYGRRGLTDTPTPESLLFRESCAGRYRAMGVET